MYKKLFFSLIVCLCAHYAVQAQFLLDVESGVVFNSRYNEVRVPGNTGTQFDLSKDFSGNSTFFYRIRAGITLSDRHTISLLYAPLHVKSTTTPDQQILFNGATFTAGNRLDASYTFNSYRLTYRYDFIRNPKLRFGAGLTAKIRDADIQLSNEQLSTTKSNVGFVPLINFYLEWNFAERFGLILEGDALVGKQGRAEDIFAGLGYQIVKDKVTLKAGYRVLEGGADNDEVYNFTWFDYASAGLIFRL
ncbi:hypothetical protein GXP67_35455 [Rhodocytophaga rosea]|uniref:Outer membrane beta-barrel protein n=1 Tax=Rhodocytophaga rosea TaxID=2704465 RepID=A0A6C0GWB9_9BACT|nr:hypothetical protein [Rhodocytophaga rosea]QHT71590.1 hypothetical protein GXP67_35455 [Rhodocytophaga rosea]